MLTSFTAQPLFTKSSNIIQTPDGPVLTQATSPYAKTSPTKTVAPFLTTPSAKARTTPTPGERLPGIAQLREASEKASDQQSNTDQTEQSRVPIKYEVQEGDTISDIAEKFGITADSILGSNALADPDDLQIGDELLIPPVTGLLHTVTEGDNLHDLAALYGVTPESIAEFNELPDPNSLELGALLVVPDGQIQYARADSAGRGGRPSQSPAAATGSFQWPAGGTITQYYGENGHSGLDIAAGMGSPIYAADSGVVVTALKLSYGYGWYLVIDHENGYRTLYSHLSAFYTDYGERVTKGQTIAAMGSTGLSTGPHLHFEVFINGVRDNPLNYLP
jgi:murein DD-endopeptidase MepM/ murein hydrolase activator NlpD